MEFLEGQAIPLVGVAWIMVGEINAAITRKSNSNNQYIQVLETLTSYKFLYFILLLSLNH